MNSDNTPKYMLVVNWAKELIYSNQFKLGDKFYSENEIGEQFQLSRQTVRKSLDILENENLIKSKRGSGTFITYCPTTAKKTTMNIAVVSTYLNDYIFTGIIEGIESILSAHQYTMQLYFTRNKIENESKILKMLLEKEIDGIIIEPTKSALPNPNLHYYENIRLNKIPLIFFNAYYPALRFPHISLNDREAGALAAQRLIHAGCKNIGGIFQSDDLQGHLRYQGFLEALNKNNIPLETENLFWYTTEDKEDFLSIHSRIFRQVQTFDGLVCYNDQIAYGIYNQLKLMEIAIPEQISIVSIDNSELAMMTIPQLTSIVNPVKDLGALCATNLLELIQNPEFQATFEFPAKIMERNSAKALH